MDTLSSWVDAGMAEPVGWLVIGVVAIVALVLVMRVAAIVFRVAMGLGALLLFVVFVAHLDPAGPTPGDLAKSVPVEVVSADERGMLIRAGGDTLWLNPPDGDFLDNLPSGEALIGMLRDDIYDASSPALCWPGGECLRLPDRDRVCRFFDSLCSAH